jgi:hypothetical protein
MQRWPVFFPGNASRIGTIKDMQRKSKDTTNLEGSSVATAVAAGFAAMILPCVEILLVKQPEVEEHPEANAIRQALRKSETWPEYSSWVIRPGII